MDTLTLSALREVPPESVFIADCRHALADPDAGRRAFARGHLPGAVHLHLDTDLSAPLHPEGLGGRHPLPEPQVFAARMRTQGLKSSHRVLAWDDRGGPFAARLWFLLRWLGHERVQVLQGSLEGQDLETGTPEPRPPGDWQANPQPGWLAEHDEVVGRSGSGGLLVDCRAPARYRGEVEPIDPVGGHIPGAINRHWGALLDDGVLARSPDVPGPDPIFYCGSGVTACVSLLAHRGATGGGRLYVGSWSGWLASEGKDLIQAGTS